VEPVVVRVHITEQARQLRLVRLVVDRGYLHPVAVQQSEQTAQVRRQEQLGQTVTHIKVVEVEAVAALPLQQVLQECPEAQVEHMAAVAVAVV
jgi:hypothetical protein